MNFVEKIVQNIKLKHRKMKNVFQKSEFRKKEKKRKNILITYNLKVKKFIGNISYAVYNFKYEFIP